MSEFERNLIQLLTVIGLTAGLSAIIGGLWWAFCSALGINMEDEDPEDGWIYDGLEVDRER